MAADEKFRIWDAYWHENRIYSAGVDADPAISQSLDQQWGMLARVMPEGSRILDLACGNGAVGLAMARANKDGGPSLNITGIDSAAIDPPRFVTDHAELLRTIEFKPMVKMESLPFPDDSFDAVVSQYGLEYGSSREALAEAVNGPVRLVSGVSGMGVKELLREAYSLVRERKARAAEEALRQGDA